ncbi:MAG: DEAD/DEAH box helicase [Deltaproteobacteria bacterium]|nr:DEAD/DEAH box helicase [Deltaproteobacteria bacterium]
MNDLAEARLMLLDLCHGKTDPLPSELLVAQVLAHHGDASWAVKREAMAAVLRRLASGRREGLKVASGPAGGEPLGLYRTRRRRAALRPYRTVLRGLAPLETSCDCPDFLRNSLGLCKHALAVLTDLAARPRRFARASRAARASQPRLVWDPILPLEGEGDWLARLRLERAGRPELPGTMRHVGLRFRRGDGRLRQTFRDRPGTRLALVEELLEVQQGAAYRDADPALEALLIQEQVRLSRLCEDRRRLGPAKKALRALKQPLYPYQSEGTERFLREGRLLVADDMGLGKTAQAIAAAHALWSCGAVRRGLIIVPASLRDQWRREWASFTDAPVRVVDGPAAGRHRLYRQRPEGFLLASYASVRRDLHAIRAFDAGMVVLDEAQRIKNWETRTAAAIKQLDAPYRLVLTGTPLENRLDELASIMDWVDDRALEPKWRLSPAHTVTADGAREVVGVRGLDTLRRRLAATMVRRTRPEILDQLPPRTETVIPVALTPEQWEAHEDLDPPIRRLLATGRRRPLRPQEFHRLMSLLTHQRIAANGIAQLDFERLWPSLSVTGPDPIALGEAGSPKLLELRKIVERVVLGEGRKVVVFSQWRRMLTLAHWAVSDLLEEAGLRAAFFTGKEGRRRREQNLVDFHDDPAARILFATDAGGVGLNLQRAASCCVNLELPWNPAVLEQRIGRVHRLGQRSPVEVYNLMGRACIEERMAATLSDKRALFSGLFDGEADEIRFERSGSFLSRMERVLGPEPGAPTSAPASLRAERGGGSAAAPEHRLLPAAELGRLLSGLRIQSRADGGLGIQASPEAAKLLGPLFEGLAGLLARASGAEV